MKKESRQHRERENREGKVIRKMKNKLMIKAIKK
jgi:hypothetical protein